MGCETLGDHESADASIFMELRDTAHLNEAMLARNPICPTLDCLSFVGCADNRDALSVKSDRKWLVDGHLRAPLFR